MPDSWPLTPSFSNRRRWVIALNVLLSALAVFSLVLMANYLAARHFTRSHWAAENPYQLSALTLEMLRSLTNQVRAVVFFEKQNALYSSVSSLLMEYQLACPKLTVDYVDYLRNPGAAQLIKERYRLSFPEVNNDVLYRNLVIFECDSQIKIVHEKELYDLDVVGALSGKTREIKRTNFKGELLFTAALLRVTDPKRFKAYFLTGHRENDPQNDDAQMGFSKFAAVLQQNNIQVEQLDLSRGEIPADGLLIIAGPQNRFQPVELEKIDRFLSQGGRMLALLNNLGRTGLEKILAAWGVKVGDDVVLELQPGGKVGDRLAANRNLVITNYVTTSHPVTRPLLRSRLHLVLPRSVEKESTSRQDADAPRVDVLAASGENSLATTDIRDEVLYENLFRDRRGPIPVMVAVEKGTVQGISGDHGATRMLVVGDSIFLGNYMIDSLNNQDFAVLAVNWLLDRTQLMGGIGPRPVREFQVVITPSQLLAMRWLLLGLLPLTVLCLGLVVWWRRRQ